MRLEIIPKVETREAPAVVTQQQKAAISEAIDWTAYADAYDLIPEFFPTYKDNQELLRERVEKLNLPANASICDIGAGTGNYIAHMSSYMPNASFLHLDSNKAMNAAAEKKYKDLPCDVRIVESSVDEASLEEGAFDLLICINALYNMSPQATTLARFKRWLKPNGWLFVIDFGRQQQVGDWLSQFLRNAILGKIKGEAYKRALSKGPTLVRQAMLGTKAQTGGEYWTHSTEEFGDTISAAGFNVVELGVCYRGYCDFVLATNG